MHALKIVYAHETSAPAEHPIAAKERPQRSSLRVYPREERPTVQMICAAQALALYAQGWRVEDEDGEPYGVPADDGQGWTDRDVPRRPMSDGAVRDVQTIMRLGGPLAGSTVVTRSRFRLAAHEAQLEKAKREHARAVALREQRHAEHGRPSAELVEWPQPLSGCLSWYGWGVRNGYAYGTYFSSGPHAGRNSGFGRQMDTGNYAIRMASPPPLAGEWRRVTEPPVGDSILIVDDSWIDCAQHRSGRDRIWAVPICAEARAQMDNWIQLHAAVMGGEIEIQRLDLPLAGYEEWFQYERAGSEHYTDRGGDGVVAVDRSDAWGVAAQRIPWLCRDGERLLAVDPLHSYTGG